MTCSWVSVRWHQLIEPDSGTLFFTIPLISFWSSAAKISSSTISNAAVEAGSNFSSQIDASQTSLDLSRFSLPLDELHNSAESADQLSGRELLRATFKLCASSSISSNVFASLPTQLFGVTSFLPWILWHYRSIQKTHHCLSAFFNNYINI